MCIATWGFGPDFARRLLAPWATVLMRSPNVPCHLCTAPLREPVLPAWPLRWRYPRRWACKGWTPNHRRYSDPNPSRPSQTRSGSPGAGSPRPHRCNCQGSHGRCGRCCDGIVKWYMQTCYKMSQDRTLPGKIMMNFPLCRRNEQVS